MRGIMIEKVERLRSIKFKSDHSILANYSITRYTNTVHSKKQNKKTSCEPAGDCKQKGWECSGLVSKKARTSLAVQSLKPGYFPLTKNDQPATAVAISSFATIRSTYGLVPLT